MDEDVRARRDQIASKNFDDLPSPGDNDTGRLLQVWRDALPYDAGSGHCDWGPGDDRVCLDGWFTVAELRRLVEIIEAHTPAPPEPPTPGSPS